MNPITQTAKVLLLATILAFGISYVYAWTAPTSNPPAGNVSAPINTSGVAQIKDGGLTIANLSSVVNGLIVRYGNIGIGVTAPTSKLSVDGGVQVGVDAAACVAGKAGTLRWSGGKIEVCTGSIWKVVGSPTTWDCSWGAISNQRYNGVTYCPSAGLWCGSGLTAPTCVSSWTHISDCYGYEYISDCRAN